VLLLARRRPGLVAAGMTAGVLTAGWLLGSLGAAGYWRLLERLSAAETRRSYGLTALLLAAGLSRPVARAASVGAAGVLLAAPRSPTAGAGQGNRHCSPARSAPPCWTHRSSGATTPDARKALQAPGRAGDEHCHDRRLRLGNTRRRKSRAVVRVNQQPLGSTVCRRFALT